MINRRLRDRFVLYMPLLLVLLSILEVIASTVEVAPPFRAFYHSGQGVRLIDYPLGGLETTNGYCVQDIEKGRIEDHRGENGDPGWQFMYGRLVAELVAAGGPLPHTEPTAP